MLINPIINKENIAAISLLVPFGASLNSFQTKISPDHSHHRRCVAKGIRDSRIGSTCSHKTNHHAAHPDKASQHTCEMGLGIAGKVIFHGHRLAFYRMLHGERY